MGHPGRDDPHFYPGGHYFPGLLGPRRRAEQALLSVLQETYVLGISTRKVETPVKALGMTGLSKSEVSRICGGLDDQVENWRRRTLVGLFPYLWLDATCVKVREAGRVTSRAVVVAYAVAETGCREADILAHMFFPAEHWRQLHSTNPLERLNKEIKRRSNVVGIFPDYQAG